MASGDGIAGGSEIERRGEALGEGGGVGKKGGKPFYGGFGQVARDAWKGLLLERRGRGSGA